MKVALFVPSWPPGQSANGIVTYASMLVPALRHLGHTVFILTPAPTAPSNSDPNVIDLSSFSADPNLLDRMIMKIAPAHIAYRRLSAPIVSAIDYLFEKYGLDVLEMEESFGWSFSVSKSGHVPVVVRLHGPWCVSGQFEVSDKNGFWNRGRDELEGRAIRHAHFVTAPSAAILRDVQKYYDINLLASRVVANPIKSVPERETWKASSCSFQLLFVGRFDNRKGGDLVLKTFAELASRYPELRLTFIGPDSGVLDAGGKKLRFNDFITEHIPEQFRPRIVYRGQLSHADLLAIRREHLVTIVASQWENSSYAVMEAMSLGSPIVATDVGGNPELLRDQYNAILVPANDLSTMITACDKLLSDTAFAARLGQQAWLDCRRVCDPLVIAEQTVATYQEARAIFLRERQRL